MCIRDRCGAVEAHGQREGPRGLNARHDHVARRRAEDFTNPLSARGVEARFDHGLVQIEFKTVVGYGGGDIVEVKPKIAEGLVAGQTVRHAHHHPVSYTHLACSASSARHRGRPAAT